MMQRILFVGAHHDDLELGLGGSVKLWSSQRKEIFAAFTTTSQWISPEGKVMRDPALAIADCERSAAILGFKPIHLGFSTDAMELTPSDHHTVEILKLITKYKIDTLITAWAHDAHPAHRATNQIAMAATRKIPTVLTCRLSWNSVPEGYKPNFFVDVSDTLEDKIIALKCYKDEWLRTGVLWEKYIRAIASVYGLEANFEAAEGFEVIKLCQ